MPTTKWKYPAPSVIKASGKHTATVIMMHGLGDTAQGWLPVGQELKGDLPHVKWIFPTAPTRPISVNGGMAMPGWFDIFELGSDTMDTKEDADGIADATAFVGALIKQELDAGLPAERVVVGGFSQGGAVALHALRQPQKLAGVIGLSTWMPLHRSGALLSPECAGLPVLLGHGTQDQLVHFKFAEATHKLLKDQGARVTWRQYTMAHSACPEEIADVGQFLKRALPPT